MLLTLYIVNISADLNHSNIQNQCILPPFFRVMVDYVEKNEDPWCTPGHQGGMGFLKNEQGRYFYNFFGPNIFKADIQSLPEFGSVFGHTGPVKKSEEIAAKIFGADYTFFVTNGSSSSNRLLFRFANDEIVLIDRNCHKSVMQGIINSNTIPVYMPTTRNIYGIIGPIESNTFNNLPIKNKARLSVITNSTYDGLCYDVDRIKQLLRNRVDFMLFDEAWFAYAKFSPLYSGRFAMGDNPDNGDYPPIFASQSTHKMLNAFSMAAMVHIKNGTKYKIDPNIFNEAWMMETTTSPFYPIIASLDIATSMMANSGSKIMHDMLMDAIDFRKKMALIQKAKDPDWWFSVWQPPGIEKYDTELLIKDPKFWLLNPNESWHGFSGLTDENIMLDPLKVTIITPGLNINGMDDTGIPALLVSKFLDTHHIIPEKEGYYNLLFLFSAAASKDKYTRLLNALSEFKIKYDNNIFLKEVIPDLVEEYPEHYEKMGLKDLAQRMHNFLKEKNIPSLIQTVYSTLPEQTMRPAIAFRKMFNNQVEYVNVKDLLDRTVAVILAPYPPGIPIVMPGERLTKKSEKIIDYFILSEDFANKFPGFDVEIHGVVTKINNNHTELQVLCIKQ